MRSNLLRFLKNLAAFVRWRDWGPGKVPVFCIGLFYAGLANGQTSGLFCIDVVKFLFFITLQSALGYVLNNWSDRHLDELHGKENSFRQLTHAQGVAAIGVLFFLACLSVLPFIERKNVLWLWMALMFLSYAYSMKPLRLKERGFAGLIAATLAQWPVPIMLTFAAMNRFGGWDMVIFVLALTMSGATLEVAHQRSDRMRDLSTQTKTFAARMPEGKLDRLFLSLLLLDKLAIGALLITIAMGLQPLPLMGRTVSPGIPLVTLYVLLLAYSLFETVRSLRHGCILDPYNSSVRNASNFLHETLLNFVVPISLMALASAYNPVNGAVLVIFLFWRLILGAADWKWPITVLLGRWSNIRHSRHVP